MAQSIRQDPILTVAASGSPSEIGHAQGEALRERIAATIEIYRHVFEKSEDFIKTRASLFEKRIRAFGPDLAEEIDAMAEAAGQPSHWLYALNARSEFLADDIHTALPECTALYDPTTCVLAQTWDWIDRLEPLFFVLDVTRPNGHRLLTVTEPGIVGKIGLNAAGVGVCLNFLSFEAALDGVPIHVVLRAMLEARTLKEARLRADAAGAGKAANMLVGAADGQYFDLEFAGAEVWDAPLTQDRPFVHTNHYLSHAIPAGFVRENSQARFDRASDLARSPVGVSEAAALLSDRDGSQNAICSGYLPYLFNAKVGTVCTCLMDLKARELHVRPGPNPEGIFERFAL